MRVARNKKSISSWVLDVDGRDLVSSVTGPNDFLPVLLLRTKVMIKYTRLGDFPVKGKWRGAEGVTVGVRTVIKRVKNRVSKKTKWTGTRTVFIRIQVAYFCLDLTRWEGIKENRMFFKIL